MEEQNQTQNPKSSTGLEENIAGFLCYLGLFVTGLIFLFLEKSSRFIRFHAMQSVVTFLSLWVVYFVIGLIPLFGGFLNKLVSLLSIVLWIVLMVKAYQKELYKLPIASQVAENLLQAIDNNRKTDAKA